MDNEKAVEGLVSSSISPLVERVITKKLTQILDVAVKHERGKLAAAEARIAELETEIAQWRDMGIRAVTGGRGAEGGDLIPNQIWPNGWQQDIAIVAYLVHCHEARIAALEKALDEQRMREIFNRFHNERYNPASEQYRFEHFYAALLKEKE